MATKVLEETVTEGGKTGAKGVTEAAIKFGEAAIAHTITAKKSVIISILNESELTLDRPEWEMKHGHVASEGIPPEFISKSSSQQGVDITFVKPRVSAYGCEGVLLYRYIECDGKESKDQNCFLAVRFSVPAKGQNKCTLALLSEQDKSNSERVQTYDFVTPKLYKFVKKAYFTHKPNDIDQIRSKSSKWMELKDVEEKIKFGCTMSGEDHAIIKVKISKMKQESKEQPKKEQKEQPKEEQKEQPKEEQKEQPKEEPKEEQKEEPKQELELKQLKSIDNSIQS